MHYKHTQPGTLLRWILGLSLITTFGMAIYFTTLPNLPEWTWFSFGVAPIIIFLCAWLFGSLTVQIEDGELSHWFGPGFWKKSYQLVDIESATAVRNSWIFGWGIRLTPHGWLYNVSGLDAVQIELRSGRKLRIGTDDPKGLVEAISHD
mgnify:FL=1